MHKKYNESQVKLLAFNCSTSPSYTKDVKECLEDFDVNDHPNRRLLPGNDCGRQKSGGKNSVDTLALIYEFL